MDSGCKREGVMREGGVPRESESMRLMKANPIGYVILGMGIQCRCIRTHTRPHTDNYHSLGKKRTFNGLLKGLSPVQKATEIM